MSSIQTLAAILGEEIASKDLALIFKSFIRDLDEVKIGSLEHPADFLDFLKLLNTDIRNRFLPHLKEFIDVDWNWKYRKECEKQWRFLINLCTSDD